MYRLSRREHSTTTNKEFLILILILRMLLNVRRVCYFPADLLVCAIVAPLKLADVYNVFSWNHPGCIFYVVLRYTPVFVCMNTVVLIAIERWVSSVLPAKSAAFANPRNVRMHLVLVWVALLVELLYPLDNVKVRILLSEYITKEQHAHLDDNIVAIHLTLMISYTSVSSE